MLIAIAESEAIALANIIATQFEQQLWVGFDQAHVQNTSVKMCQANDYRQHLGSEVELLVYNAYKGLKPSALYALEGCIKKSGLLVLISPNIDVWSRHEGLNPGLKFSYQDKHTKSLFIEYFCAAILKSKFTAQITEKQIHLPLNSAEQPEPDYCRAEQCDRYLTSDQALVLRSIKESFNTQKTIRALILGKRGVGKSTLLGEIYKWALQKAFSDVVICAANKGSCDSTLKVITTAFPSLTKQNIPFIAPDALHTINTSSLILIDEAAALAPQIIKDAFKRFKYVVLATTEIGYEGSGLGFRQKLKPLLNSYKDTQEFHLKTPVRWPEDDPLEALFEDAFVTHLTNTDTTEVSSETKNEEFEFECIDSNEKDLHNLSDLHACHYILASAHYQTTPDDLMRLMDSDDQMLIVVRLKGKLCAACIIVKERLNIDQDLSNNISLSKRRLSGNLTNQTIAAMLMEPNCVNLYTWRINRIAVLPEYQGKSIGSKMLRYIESLASAHDIDLLSTSFGLDASLFRFWTRANFELIKIGTRRDTSSGNFSGLFIKPIQSKHQQLVRLLKYRFASSSYYLKALSVIPLEFDLGTSTALDETYGAAAEAYTQVLERKFKALIDQQLEITNAFEEAYYFAHWKKDKELFTTLNRLLKKGNSKEQKQTLKTTALKLIKRLL